MVKFSFLRALITASFLFSITLILCVTFVEAGEYGYIRVTLASEKNPDHDHDKKDPNFGVFLKANGKSIGEAFSHGSLPKTVYIKELKKHHLNSKSQKTPIQDFYPGFNQVQCRFDYTIAFSQNMNGPWITLGKYTAPIQGPKVFIPLGLCGDQLCSSNPQIQKKLNEGFNKKQIDDMKREKQERDQLLKVEIQKNEELKKASKQKIQENQKKLEEWTKKKEKEIQEFKEKNKEKMTVANQELKGKSVQEPDIPGDQEGENQQIELDIEISQKLEKETESVQDNSPVIDIIDITEDEYVETWLGGLEQELYGETDADESTEQLNASLFSKNRRPQSIFNAYAKSKKPTAKKEWYYYKGFSARHVSNTACDVIQSPFTKWLKGFNFKTESGYGPGNRYAVLPKSEYQGILGGGEAGNRVVDQYKLTSKDTRNLEEIFEKAGATSTVPVFIDFLMTFPKIPWKIALSWTVVDAGLAYSSKEQKIQALKLSGVVSVGGGTIKSIIGVVKGPENKSYLKATYVLNIGQNKDYPLCSWSYALKVE